MTTPLEALIRASSEVVMLLDDDARLLFASTSASRLFGFDPIALVGRPITDVVAESDHAALRAALAEASASLPDRVVPVALKRPDGELHEVELGVRPLIERDRQTGWLLRTVDASTSAAVEAARSGDERQYAELATCSPFVIFRLDDKGGLTGLNDRWTVLTGQTRLVAAGAGWLTAIDAEDRRPFRAVAASAHTSGRGWRHTFRIRHVSGTVRWVDAASEPLSGGRGEVGVVVDVTAEIGLQREALARRS